MKEIKNFEEFKEEAEKLRKKDMKEIAKVVRDRLPKPDHVVFKEIIENSLVQEFLRTAWTGGLYAGVRLARLRYDRQKKNQFEK